MRRTKQTAVVWIQHEIDYLCFGDYTWKLGIGFGVESQAVRGFSWKRKGPLKVKVMELRLKAQTAEADMLFLKETGKC